jgi:membrane protein implicated in regulation of membrane protease activity
MPIWIWLGAAGGLLIVEMLTVNLLFGSLAFSALLSAGASALGFEIVAQGAVFGLGATFSILLLRPIALQHLQKKPENHATNVDALINAPALTLTVVTERSGLVKLAGETWSARSAAGEIPHDSEVTVVSIEGATAVVKQKE